MVEVFVRHCAWCNEIWLPEGELTRGAWLVPTSGACPRCAEMLRQKIQAGEGGGKVGDLRRPRVMIFGRENCSRCAQAKAVLMADGNAEYFDLDQIFERVDGLDTAVEVATATNGELPIILVESAGGWIVLRLGRSGQTAPSDCAGGACRIEKRGD